MSIKSEIRTIRYKGMPITYEFYFYECEMTGEKFTTTELDEENIARVKDLYAKLYKQK